MTEYSIDYDADTIRGAQKYMDYRNKQLGKFGVTVREQVVVEDNSIVTFYNTRQGGDYGSIFILKSHRGNQLYIKRLQQFMIAIITLEECGITSYLERIKCNFIQYGHSTAYKLIQEYYGDDRARRSQVPLINHIDEGGTILHHIGANAITRDAYYLHPLLQSDDSLSSNLSMNFDGVETEAVILAMEYRRVANSYLSTDSMSDFVGFTSPEIREMLLADKVQNYKDFLKHHKGRHSRSRELDTYFNNWFKLLGIRYSDYENLITD